MKINECPKCGCEADFIKDFKYDWDSDTKQYFYYVRCDNCGTVGYDDTDPEEAIRKWNDGEISLSERELYSVYVDVGFYKYFYVWADSKSDAEHRIVDAIEEGKVEFTDIAPGSLDFRNEGPTSPKLLPERYQREVLNPEEADS